MLGSGSGGNAVVLESGSARLLIDAGFSCREIERRMAQRGADPTSFKSVFLTHEHDDHCRGIDRFCRRFGASLHATAGTLAGLPLSEAAAGAARPVRSGEKYEVGGFEVEPFLVPHDAREPVGVVVEDAAGRRIG
nr:MBL fold metallo-hydrolase [Thermoanaerobaculia bacterium]